MTQTPPGSDRWIKCVSSQSNIRGVAIQATHLVKQMAELHGLSGMGARGLGEAAIAGLLVGSYCKPGERVNLNIQGNGLYKQALVDAHPDGTVRGYVIERPQRPDEITIDFEDRGPWGTGLLSILRTKGGEGKQPYIGTVPLVTGHLAKDLTFYWMQSEQVPSAVGLIANLEGDDICAGGFLVQALPGASPEEISQIENHIHDLSSLAGELARNADPIHLLSRIFQSSPFMVVEEKPLEMKCNCSWERVEKALVLVGASELQAMLKEDRKADVRCDFCAKNYEIDAEKLKKLIDTALHGAH